MPSPVTVWAVELEPGSRMEEVQGSLALGTEALVFTPREGHGPERRYPLAEVARAKRLRGSPVLLIVHEPSRGPRRTAFYFVQPPPLAPPDESRKAVLGPLAGGSPRKIRRRNVSYLGFSNREKKQVLREWEQAVQAAMRKEPGI
ncbi:MAG: hypothetical protein WD965_06595 [Actinomycetota bacterium]